MYWPIRSMTASLRLILLSVDPTFTHDLMSLRRRRARSTSTTVQRHFIALLRIERSLLTVSDRHRIQWPSCLVAISGRASIFSIDSFYAFFISISSAIDTLGSELVLLFIDSSNDDLIVKLRSWSHWPTWNILANCQQKNIQSIGFNRWQILAWLDWSLTLSSLR